MNCLADSSKTLSEPIYRSIRRVAGTTLSAFRFIVRGTRSARISTVPIVLFLAVLLLGVATASAQEAASPGPLDVPAAQATPRSPQSPATRRGADSSAQSSASPQNRVRGSASGGQSQEKEAIEEIVVTAQKRTEFAQDIPISLTALKGEELKFRGINDLGDLQLQVPGLVYGGDLEAGQHITIRGVGLDIPDASIESPNATYVDGVYQTRSFRSPALGLDLERVEVLRGPQGTLFGRNATGGAISIIMAEPTDEFAGKFIAGIGNYEQSRVEGIGSGPLIKGVLSARVALDFERYGGDVKNVFAKRVTPEYINRIDNGIGRLALKYTPLESLTADFSLIVNKETGGGVGAATVCTRMGTAQQQLQATIFPPTDPSLFICGHHPHKVKLNQADDGDAENAQGALNVRWDFSPWVSLKSVTGLQQHELFQKFDVDGTARDIANFPNRQDSSKAFSQELNLFGSTQWFTWLAGSHFMSEHFASTFSPIPLPAFALGEGLIVGNLEHEQVQSYSFFGDATVLLPKGFKAFGGVRYTHDDKSLIQTGYERAGGGTLIPIVSPAVVTGDLPAIPGSPINFCHDLKFKDSFANWSPRYGVAWEPTEELNVYVKESFGYNAGGHYGLLCDNPYKPETLDTIEAGAKSRWFGGRLVADASLFTSDFKNFQIFKILGQTSTAINAPLARMMGAEIELTALPSEGLTLNTGVSLLHSEYKKFTDVDNADSAPMAVAQDLSGRQLNRAPNYTVNLGAEYAWPIPGRWYNSLGAYTPSTIRLRGEWFLTDYILFRPFGDPEDKQSGYSLFNLFATLTPPGNKYQLRFFAKNLADKQYYGYKLALGGGIRVGVGAPPRTFGAELTAWF